MCYVHYSQPAEVKPCIILNTLWICSIFLTGFSFPFAVKLFAVRYGFAHPKNYCTPSLCGPVNRLTYDRHHLAHICISGEAF